MWTRRLVAASTPGKNLDASGSSWVVGDTDRSSQAGAGRSQRLRVTGRWL